MQIDFFGIVEKEQRGEKNKSNKKQKQRCLIHHSALVCPQEQSQSWIHFMWNYPRMLLRSMCSVLKVLMDVQSALFQNNHQAGFVKPSALLGKPAPLMAQELWQGGHQGCLCCSLVGCREHIPHLCAVTACLCPSPSTSGCWTPSAGPSQTFGLLQFCEEYQHLNGNVSRGVIENEVLRNCSCCILFLFSLLSTRDLARNKVFTASLAEHRTEEHPSCY